MKESIEENDENITIIRGNATNPNDFTLYVIRIKIKAYTTNGKQVKIKDVLIRELKTHITISFEVSYKGDQ